MPQNGILSTFLYNTYASDQPTTPFTLIADKAIIASSHSNPEIASVRLQNNLARMEDWYIKRRLNINQSKPTHATFTLRLTPCPAVSTYGTRVPSSVKYLGLILDRKLTWVQHIRSNRLNSNCYLRPLKTYSINNKHTHINIKLLIYKFLD